MTGCRHDNTSATTLEVVGLGSTADLPYRSWVCICQSCGNRTERCLTEHEAQLRGQLEWWLDSIGCEVCAHSRVETHSGDRHLVCWREGYGKKVSVGHTCPAAVRRKDGR